MLQNVPKHCKTSRNVQKGQKTSRNVPKHTKTSAMPTQAQLSMMQLSICFNLDLMLGILGTVLEGNSCRRQWHHRKITKNICLSLVVLEKNSASSFGFVLNLVYLKSTELSHNIYIEGVILH